MGVGAASRACVGPGQQGTDRCRRRGVDAARRFPPNDHEAVEALAPDHPRGYPTTETSADPPPRVHRRDTSSRIQDQPAQWCILYPLGISYRRGTQIRRVALRIGAEHVTQAPPPAMPAQKEADVDRDASHGSRQNFAIGRHRQVQPRRHQNNLLSAMCDLTNPEGAVDIPPHGTQDLVGWGSACSSAIVPWVMAEKPTKADHAAPKGEDRLAIPLDPVEALRALLKVDPESPGAEDEPAPTRRDD
jgi:hypothetical protein